ANAFASVFGTLNSTAIQLQIPDSVRGRISSFLMMSYSLPLLGVLPVSYVARELGVQLAVSGAALLAAMFGALFYALSPMLRGIDTRERLTEPRGAREAEDPLADLVAHDLGRTPRDRERARAEQHHRGQSVRAGEDGCPLRRGPRRQRRDAVRILRSEQLRDVALGPGATAGDRARGAAQVQ